MGKVDFYILGDDGADEPLHVACRLADKAWRQGHRVRVQVDGNEVLQRLDSLMWTFRQESFLPHEIDGHEAEIRDFVPLPVMLGTDSGSAQPPDVLVNLSGAVPAGAEQIPRIAEIVPPDPGAKQAGRERYRQYRERGFELDSHQI